MKKPSDSDAVLSRRNAIKGAAAVGAGGLFGCSADADDESTSASNLEAGSGRPRVAIVGGGAGGIAAAYFLQGTYDVVLFESRSKVGGHCDSQVVEYQGQKINVDLGAQFFHPDTHPIYATLLEELGLYNPAAPDSDETIEAPGSICIFPVDGWLPTFASNWAWLTPFLAIDFAIYSQAARQAILSNMSWEITIDEWVKKLPVSQRFKDTLLYPWLSAAIGTTQANARITSARSILQTFALAFPANIFQSATTFNSKLGLEGNLRRMLDRSPGTQVHVDAPVSAVSFDNGSWSVTTPAGNHGPFSALVLNAQPRIGKTILGSLPWAGEIVSLLDKYTYFDTRMLIHTDPKYVHRDRNFWSAYNGAVDNGECGGSVWYGGIHGKLANGQTINIFKSWADRRRGDPSNILFERRFKHPLITPEVVRAARALKAFQGKNKLYFSGQYTTGMDLQESAVYSAMKVADALAPQSATLASLRARLASRGRSNVNYDL